MSNQKQKYVKGQLRANKISKWLILLGNWQQDYRFMQA
jgi:hypothetical protein